MMSFLIYIISIVYLFNNMGMVALDNIEDRIDHIEEDCNTEGKKFQFNFLIFEFLAFFVLIEFSLAF